MGLVVHGAISCCILGGIRAPLAGYLSCSGFVMEIGVFKTVKGW